MKTSYQPRHTWYLADALLLIRELQAVVWPMGWHVALGGGVLNHGYSDKDLDIYVLPIYSQPGCVDDPLSVLSAIAKTLAVAGYEDVCSTQTAPHECYHYSVRFSVHDKPVEVFIVRKTIANGTEPF